MTTPKLNAAPRGALARAVTLIAAMVALALGPALASPVNATVSFPEGLAAGKKVPVTVRLSSPEEGALERLKGTRVELVVAGGQYGANRQYEVGKIGEDLRAEVSVPRTERYQVGLRFVNASQNYGSTIDIDARNAPRSLEMSFDGPVAGKHVPLPQLLLWAVGAAILGLVALRGVQAF
ncbi:MAG TPA: hypothetical protein VNT60_00650 [Deinococcales bacterium]|nr:hypothetical protein [Deinococcales bacterium]